MTTERFQIVANDYFDAGGHNMVDISTVYDKQESRMLWVSISSTSLVVTSYDYIRNELPEGIIAEKFIQYGIYRDDLTTEPDPLNSAMNDLPDDIAELIFDRWLQYIRNYAKYEKKHMFLAIEQLPNELFGQLSGEYMTWLDENDQLVETDGYKIFFNSNYDLELEYDDNGKEAVRLQKVLNDLMPIDDASDDDWQKFYDLKFQIIVNDQLFTFYNAADIYNALLGAAKEVIDNQ